MKITKTIMLTGVITMAAFAARAENTGVRITVRNEVLHPVDSRIFGQFMERESWGITAIRVNDEDHPEPYFLPTGKVTGFYSRHHGNERLFCDITGMPTYEQPLRINSIAPAPRVATVDVVATQNKDTVFLHLINRHISDPIAATLDLAGLGYEGGPVLHRYMTSEVRGDDAEISEATLTPKNNASEITISLPARSVSIVEFER